MSKQRLNYETPRPRRFPMFVGILLVYLVGGAVLNGATALLMLMFARWN